MPDYHVRYSFKGHNREEIITCDSVLDVLKEQRKHTLKKNVKLQTVRQIIKKGEK